MWPIMNTHKNTIGCSALLLILVICANSIILISFLTYFSEYNQSFSKNGHISQHAHQEVHQQTKPQELPDLFIYRRSRKSGSSSMLTALLEALVPLGYHGTYFSAGHETNYSLRSEFIKYENRRKLIILEHNVVTKSYHPNRKAVIADTVRDGYEQMTSLCRYTKAVSSCGKEMEECLRSKWAMNEIRFRWAGKEKEDHDTYIDLPLSSAHPALSTTILKTVYPTISFLDVQRFHVRKTRCPQDPKLQHIFHKLYGEMEKDIRMLRMRMLILAGYPYRIDEQYKHNISIADLLDYAENIEAGKYDVIKHNFKVNNGISKLQRGLLMTLKHWSRNNAGRLVLAQRRQ